MKTKDPVKIKETIWQNAIRSHREAKDLLIILKQRENEKHTR
tara:strand:+ start:846 stop:971 length:126 start_codon:yes stop_codon:yes gene_type:complete